MRNLRIFWEVLLFWAEPLKEIRSEHSTLTFQHVCGSKSEIIMIPFKHIQRRFIWNLISGKHKTVAIMNVRLPWDIKKNVLNKSYFEVFKWWKLSNFAAKGQINDREYWWYFLSLSDNLFIMYRKKYWSLVHDPQRINPTDVVDPLTLLSITSRSKFAMHNEISPHLLDPSWQNLVGTKQVIFFSSDTCRSKPSIYLFLSLHLIRIFMSLAKWLFR